MMLKNTALSLAVHALVYGIPYYFLVVRIPEMPSVELELSPMPARFNPGPSRRATPASEKWSIARNEEAARKAAVKAEPVADSACPPPCPDRPGDFVPAGLAGSGPRWIEGFITDDDYPPNARKLGIEGSVLLAVFIRVDGTVRDVRLVKGNYEALNQAALAKVRASRFVPAMDEAGRPVPCKLVLPIRFELH